MRKRVGKLIANQAYEAVQEVMNHLQKWSMNLDMYGEERPDSLRADYGRVRRLRDYFRNLIRAHAHPVIDLDEQDSNQLVSCCMFSAENIEIYMEKYHVDDTQRKWMRDNMNNLYLLAMEFATHPVALIGGPGRNEVPSSHICKMVRGINSRVVESQSENGAGFEDPAGGLNIVIDANDAADEEPAEYVPQEEEAASADMSVEEGVEDSVDAGSALAGIVLPDQIHLDPKMIKDPRLRSMLMMDLRALSIAMQANDFRLSSIVLSAVFESLVTDIALQSRSELELRGTPDSWNLNKVVPAILGLRSSAQDRNTLFHLLSCKNLVRPTVQLTNPIVVTKQTLEKMLDFVHRFLVETGLCGART